jgi:hypothetical protein
MRADDGSSRELTRELLHVCQPGELQVNNCHVSAMSRNRSQQFLETSSKVHSTALAVKSAAESFRMFWVAVSDDNAERFHQAAILSRLSEARTLSRKI